MNGKESLKDIIEILSIENEIMPNSRTDKDIKVIEKDLEILEIIKKKRVDIPLLISSKNAKEYFNKFLEYWFQTKHFNTCESVFVCELTETEFNFIKEWLEK